MEEQIEVENVLFMLKSLQILLECGETQQAIQLIDAYVKELASDNPDEQ